jgi:hypothetical protein
VKSTFLALPAELDGGADDAAGALLNCAPPRTATSVSLQWKASADRKGSGLASYDIFENGSAVASTNTTFTVTGLGRRPLPVRSSRADNAGNVSAFSNTVSATTRGHLALRIRQRRPDWGDLGIEQLGQSSVEPRDAAGRLHRDVQHLSRRHTNRQQPHCDFQCGRSAIDDVPVRGLFHRRVRPSIISGRWARPQPRAACIPVSRAFIAPYLDMLQYPTPSLAGIATATGQVFFDGVHCRGQRLPGQLGRLLHDGANFESTMWRRCALRAAT